VRRNWRCCWRIGLVAGTATASDCASIGQFYGGVILASINRRMLIGATELLPNPALLPARLVEKLQSDRQGADAQPLRRAFGEARSGSAAARPGRGRTVARLSQTVVEAKPVAHKQATGEPTPPQRNRGALQRRRRVCTLSRGSRRHPRRSCIAPQQHRQRLSWTSMTNLDPRQMRRQPAAGTTTEWKSTADVGARKRSTRFRSVTVLRAFLSHLGGQLPG